MTIFCESLYSQCDKGKKLFDEKNYNGAMEELRTCQQQKLLFGKSVYKSDKSDITYQKEAIKALSSLSENDFDYSEAQYYLGLFYKEGREGIEKNTTAAIKYFENARAKFPIANLELIYLYEKLGIKYSLSDYLDPIITSPDINDNDKAEAMFRWGNYYMEQQGKKEVNLDEALEWYNKAILRAADIELEKKIKDSIEIILNSSVQKEVVLMDNNKKPLAKKEVAITGKPDTKTDINGICKFEITMREKTDNPIIKLNIKGYNEVVFNMKTPTLIFTPNNFWEKLTDSTNERGEVPLAFKVGWGANKLRLGHNIEAGWGNRFNGELDMNIGKESLILVGLGFQHNSYPFSKINNTYYENLSYSSTYLAMGGKWQVFKAPKKFHFLYVNYQVNVGFNFGASYKNYLLDYELKNNGILTPLYIEYLAGLSLMKKGWGGLDLNYCFAFDALNSSYKQTINGIEFEPLKYNYHSFSQSLLLNLVIFIFK